MTPLNAALAYLQRGFSVIPIEPKGKRPIFPWEIWQKEHPNESTVRGWWDSTHEYAARPDANLGIVTGSISNLVVVDLDTNEAKDALKAMLGQNQLLGIPRVRTGRGWQLFFGHPGIVFPNRAGVISGLDIRGDGGYVVAPPSIHPNGKEYKWEVALTPDLPALPEGLLQLCLAPPPASPSSMGFDTANALKGVPEGKRDETIYKLACKLRGADVPQEMAERLVQEAAANCSPPFSEVVAKEKVDRAYRRFTPRGETLRESEHIARSDTPRQPSYWPELVGIKSVIDSPKGPATDWVWADTLPAGAASLLVAKPKVGKSNIAVNLSIAIARGLPFLSRATKQGKVGYIFEDGGLDEIAEVFAKFGVNQNDPIMLHSGSVPELATTWLLQMAERAGLGFVVIDTIQRFFRFKEINSYSEVTNTMEPLLDGMQKLGCHVMFVHHAKKESNDTLDSAVGSTALRGLCYTFMHYKRLPNSEERVLMTDQRSGKNMKQSAVQFDWKTGWLMLAKDCAGVTARVMDLFPGARVVG